MTIGKRILALLGLLILFIVYSVYSFDYDKTLTKEQFEQPQEENGFITTIKNKLVSLVGSDDDSAKGKPLSFDLVKQNGVVTINGTFKDEQQLKDINDILNINNKGDLKYEPSISMDVELLNKIASLVTPFKDFFFDGAKLSVSNGQVLLDGKLKDTNYKDLLESIIARVDIDIKTNVQEPAISEIQDIVEGSKESITSSAVLEDSKTTDIVSPEKDMNESTTTKEEVPSQQTTNEIKQEDSVTKQEVQSIVEKPVSETKVEDKPKDEFVPKVIPRKDIKLSDKSKEVQSKINQILASKKISFQRRSSKMTDDSALAVQEIVKILKENSNISIEIGGHTDSRGRDSLNKKISQERASSIMDYLVSQGVDKTKLTAIGYGEEYPIAKDDENGLSEANRRVEFIIIGE